MVKLIKTAPTGWAGNGFGNNSAEYVVEGSEHIVVFDRGGVDWCAFDTKEGKYVIRPYGMKKKQVIEQLDDILNWHCTDQIGLDN
jgi:hypothetical protein